MLVYIAIVGLWALQWGLRKEKLWNLPEVTVNCSELVFNTAEVPDDPSAARLKPQLQQKRWCSCSSRFPQDGHFIVTQYWSLTTCLLWENVPLPNSIFRKNTSSFDVDVEYKSLCDQLQCFPEMLNRFREMLSNSLVGLGEFNNSQKSLCKRKSISLVAAHSKILKLLESYRPKIWNLFDEKTVWALFKVDSICFLKKHLYI